MFAGPPEIIECGEDPGMLDASLEALEEGPGIFELSLREGEPYFGKTNVLRRRLKRLLRERTGPSRLLNLRGLVTRIEIWRTASRLEAALILYEKARIAMPGTYLEFLKLRMPPYVKLILSNRFPRTQVVTRISAGKAQYYGPFRTRVSAEQFEHEFLDLFQIRRCPEDLEPRPDHPGCIYGEMNMCLRPCQEVVGDAEYASEVARVSEFLADSGKHLLASTQSARDHLSAELNFEEAARQHKRMERIEQVVKLRDDLVRDIDRLSGVAVTASTQRHSVNLWFLVQGVWLAPVCFSVAMTGDQPVPLDHRLRELASSLAAPHATPRERQEHLAILARWCYSTWRDGEWLPFENVEKLSFRKLTGAVSRVAAAAAE
jgi:excinuclease ABC subunit C